jgi:DNA-directed RNA polymerase specialized sigma24 family protein
MSSKSRTRKGTQPTMSPLLRALTYSRAAHEPVTQAMLLQAYVSLDAFRRGHGSRDLFTTLARHLLVAEELCRLGHHSDAIADIHAAHGAMTHIDAAEKAEGAWSMSDSDYAALRLALEIFAGQLPTASLGDIAKAEAQMLESMLRSERELVSA